MQNKTNTLKQLVAAGNVREALKLASSFRLGLTTAERSILKTGYECGHCPDFYRQLKIDPQAAIDRAWALLQVHPIVVGKA